MTLHENAPLGQIHAVHNWEYANAAARTGASGFTADDVGKVALQQDNNSYWVLTAVTPTWVPIGRVPLSGSGNPNGVTSGSAGDHYYDSTNGILYYCHTDGTSNWIVV